MADTIKSSANPSLHGLVVLNPDGTSVASSSSTSSSTSTSATSVSVTDSNTTILATNTSRKMASIYNEGAETAYVKLGASATTSSYTIPIVSSGYYELPKPIYTGVIDAITASGTATLRITEFT
jgi:hypothetical protein